MVTEPDRVAPEPGGEAGQEVQPDLARRRLQAHLLPQGAVGELTTPDQRDGEVLGEALHEASIRHAAVGPEAVVEVREHRTAAASAQDRRRRPGQGHAVPSPGAREHHD